MKWIRHLIYRTKRRIFLFCKPKNLTVYLFQGVEKVGMTGLYDPQKAVGWGSVNVEWASAEMCIIQIRPPANR